MTKLKVVRRDGVEQLIDGQSDQTVMENIKYNGVDDLLAMCGGCCSCATCHVYVDPEFLDRLPPMTSDEDDLLDSSEHRQANSRLSCQLQLVPELEGLRVTVAPED